MEEEVVRWMLPGGATILTVPKFDTDYRGITRNNGDREVRKRERRERMEEWRQIIRDTRLAILTESSARDQLSSSFRGTISRDPTSIVSYLDGTRHLRTEIERYDASLKDRIVQILSVNDDEELAITGGHPGVDAAAANQLILLNQRIGYPPANATEEDYKKYNEVAFEQCKEIYIAYPFTRRLDVYDDLYEYDY